MAIIEHFSSYWRCQKTIVNLLNIFIAKNGQLMYEYAEIEMFTYYINCLSKISLCLKEMFRLHLKYFAHIDFLFFIIC